MQSERCTWRLTPRNILLATNDYRSCTQLPKPFPRGPILDTFNSHRPRLCWGAIFSLSIGLVGGAPLYAMTGAVPTR